MSPKRCLPFVGKLVICPPQNCLPLFRNGITHVIVCRFRLCMSSFFPPSPHTFLECSTINTTDMFRSIDRLCSFFGGGGVISSAVPLNVIKNYRRAYVSIPVTITPELDSQRGRQTFPVRTYNFLINLKNPKFHIARSSTRNAKAEFTEETTNGPAMSVCVQPSFGKLRSKQRWDIDETVLASTSPGHVWLIFKIAVFPQPVRKNRFSYTNSHRSQTGQKWKFKQSKRVCSLFLDVCQTLTCPWKTAHGWRLFNTANYDGSGGFF